MPQYSTFPRTDTSISGTVTIAQPVAVTESGIWTVRIQDTAGGTLTSTATALDVNLKSSGVTQPVSGTVTANQGTSPWVTNVSQFGGAAVVTGTGASGAGIPRVTVSSDSSLTNISGTISLPTGAATQATLALIPVAQASTTAGESGPLVQGAVTTAAPTYTTGQTDPLSLTTSGALRVDASGSTQPVSGTVAATQSGTWSTRTQDGSGNAITSAAPSTGIRSLHTQVPDTTIATVTFNALNALISISTAGVNTVSFQLLAGTFAGTITPYISVDGGTNIVATKFYDPINNRFLSNVVLTNPNALTVYTILNVGGASNCLVRVDAFTSGSAVASMRATTSTIVQAPPTPFAGTITQAAVSVGTTAVRLTVAGTAPSAVRSLLMANVDSAVTAKFYIGSSTVTNSGATRGIQMVSGQTFQANNDAGDYFIISDTAAQTVFITEQA